MTVAIALIRTMSLKVAHIIIGGMCERSKNVYNLGAEVRKCLA